MDIMPKVLELGLPAEKQAETPKQVLVRMDRAAKKTDTDPTEAQKDSGRYRKGRISAHGLRIAIENPRGSVRSGTAPDGKKWSTKMHAHYGYVEGTIGKDLDPVDVFIGDEPHSEYVLVINQVDPKTSLFDEHKVMLGYTSRKGAENCYMSNYEDGWKGMGKTTPMTMDQFKEWLESGDQKKQAADRTVQAYKQFRTLMSRPDELLPLFIDNQKAVPQDEWVEAENIPTKGFAPRPGWHAGALPAAPHLRSKKDRIQPGRVWAEVEMPADVDWQSKADESPTKDIRDEVPEGGHYRKSTPQMQGGEWLIGGKLRVRRVLSDDQVSAILRAAGEYAAAKKERHKAAEDSDDKGVEEDQEHIPTLGVDLDGTLAEDGDFDPKHIPAPRKGARSSMQQFRGDGYRLIVNTVRGDVALIQRWLRQHRIPYDYINESPDQPVGSSGKLYADAYIDDRGISADRPWSQIKKEVKSKVPAPEKKSEDAVYAVPSVWVIPGGDSQAIQRNGQTVSYNTEIHDFDRYD